MLEPCSIEPCSIEPCSIEPCSIEPCLIEPCSGMLYLLCSGLLYLFGSRTSRALDMSCSKLDGAIASDCVTVHARLHARGSRSERTATCVRVRWGDGEGDMRARVTGEDEGDMARVGWRIERAATSATSARETLPLSMPPPCGGLRVAR